MQREAPLADRSRATNHALRVGRGLREPANWMQLVKFSVVGASGYVVNLAVYTTLVKAFSVHYILAAVLAFCVAVTNNFLWNRHWTFRATEGHMGFQAARFFTVSVLALGLNLIVLEVLVTAADTDQVLAQAIAILAATPLNFIGNKLWSFGSPHRHPRRSARLRAAGSRGHACACAGGRDPQPGGAPRCDPDAAVFTDEAAA